ncbi:MAG: type II toxin-antitoxin system RelE family toxin [Candidatus Nanoarchaeia archaeon]
MSYIVKLSPKAKQFLDKSERIVKNRIRAKLKKLKDNPLRYVEHYEGLDCYKVRIGDYRALVDLDMKRSVVFVRVIDHRKRIYKRFRK